MLHRIDTVTDLVIFRLSVPLGTVMAHVAVEKPDTGQQLSAAQKPLP